MPGMNGFEFLEAYEALDPRHRGSTVVVMLSSSPDPTDRNKALSFACVKGYAIKPLEPEAARGLAQYLRP